MFPRAQLYLVALAVLLVGIGVVGVTYPGPTEAATNPTLTNLSPANGTVVGGTSVTITGSNFLPGATVFFGGAPASSVNVESSTRLTAVTPSGSIGSVNVLVRNADGGAAIMTAAYFYTSVTSQLSIAGLSVSSGRSQGGTPVMITGTGFTGSVIFFGGTPATEATVLGPSAISVVTPPGLPGAVTVAVRNSDGVIASLPGAFTYEAGGLELASVSPGGGPTGGGTAVRVSGSGFAPGSRLLFGGVDARDVVVVNPTVITATAPARSPGMVSVQVVTPDGQSAALGNAFTYRAATEAPGFVVTSISPPNGDVAGGTVVDVFGTGFSGAATAYFGGSPASILSAAGPSTITVRTPPGVSGRVPVTIVNSDGTVATLNSGFLYEGADGVAVTQTIPVRTLVMGGTVVEIRGRGFVRGAMVTIGGFPASNVWVVGEGLAYATVAAGVGTGAAVTVTLTNPGGPSASLVNGYFAEGGASTGAGPSQPGSAVLPPRGFGLFVFAGGSNAQLVASVSCAAPTLTFWAANATGEFDTFVPGAAVAAVNAAWNARFPSGIPANTPLVGRCAS